MLPLPAFPTDNLYKFMALTGLVLFLFSLVYPWAKLLEIELSIADLRAQEARTELQENTVKRRLSVLEKKESATEQEVATLRDLLDRAELAAIETTRARKGITIQLEYLRRYHIGSWIGGTVGIILANVGFLLWYRRVQRPQDLRLLRSEDARMDA